MFGSYLDCGHDHRGRHITMRPPLIKWAPLYQRWMSDPDVTRYLCRRQPPTLKEEIEWLRAHRDRVNDWLWAICADGQPIGNCGLKADARKKTAHTGLVIGEKEYWGSGIASLVFARRARFAFTEIEIAGSEPDHHCVAIFTGAFAPNRGSWHAAEKAGYERYGEEPFADLIDGVYVPMYHACLSRERWESLNVRRVA